jgi:hypothetical protein
VIVFEPIASGTLEILHDCAPVAVPDPPWLLDHVTTAVLEVVPETLIAGALVVAGGTFTISVNGADVSEVVGAATGVGVLPPALEAYIVCTVDISKGDNPAAIW